LCQGGLAPGFLSRYARTIIAMQFSIPVGTTQKKRLFQVSFLCQGGLAPGFLSRYARTINYRTFASQFENSITI